MKADEPVDEEKSLKTASSRRGIPIHQTLFELGFGDFLEFRRLSGTNLVTFLKSLNDADCGGFFWGERMREPDIAQRGAAARRTEREHFVYGNRATRSKQSNGPVGSLQMARSILGRSLTSAGISKSTLHSQNARHDPLHALLDLEYCK